MTIEELKRKKDFVITPKGGILCGYTGRDTSVVLKHVEELKKAGVKPPPSIPMFYPKSPQGICMLDELFVQGVKTSGEVEFVLILDEENLCVGLGSDHTDRELEQIDILKSKQVCPAVVSKSFWSYEEISNHWDQIEIRSWAVDDGVKTLYQEARLSSILSPEQLLSEVRERIQGSLQEIFIFSGTPPLITDGFLFPERFECVLTDPVLNREIGLGYSIHTLDWFKG
ncbi:MAG: DUF2848 domain-containing protein [Anaerolineales bacterium]|nr:DUF2848 domain-containing protein [Anaerolineales bacterium]